MKLVRQLVPGRRTSEPMRAILLIMAAFGVLSSGVLFAQDTTPPTLTSLTFTPTTINVASAPQNVTVNFSATDNSSGLAGVNYVEVGFADPTGSVFQRGCASSAAFAVPGCSPLTAGSPVTGSLTVAFPRFSTQGAWTVRYALVYDAAFNLTFLGPLGFGPLPNPPVPPLQVDSVVDTTSPTMTAFTLTPTSIDTTAGSATVNMTFTLTDTISGASKWQISFTSPSGASTRSATVSLTPGTTVNGTASITFPQFSEAGPWTITSCIMADAVGNTTVWSGDLGPPVTPPPQMAAFTTTLSVASNPDATAPNLNATTGFSFTPTSVDVTSAPATITVSFQATDPTPNPSGVNSFQALFTSPSGDTLGVASNFAATASKSGTATFIVPVGSELGTWVVSSVTLTDAVGNIGTLSTANLTAAGFPTQLTLVTGGTDATPPVIVPTVTPTPNEFGVNTTAPVTVTWSVTDPESSITSTTGCGDSTVSVETAGITFTCSATSAGGTSSASVTVKVDFAEPPVIQVNVSPAPNGFGWNNSASVTVTWTITYPGSSAGSTSGCGSTTVSTETAGLTLTCTATNTAGLSSSASVTVRLDRTPPVVTPIVTPAPNGAGWNNTDTTVDWLVTDSLSGGIEGIGCDASTLTAETTGTTLTCMGTDEAGNPASASYTVKIDKTLPVTSNTTATPNPVQITTGLTLTATITDAGGSNVASAEYNIDGGSFSPMTGTFGGSSASVSATIPAFTTTGIRTICVRGADTASNVGGTECILVAVYDPSGGFASGGGAVLSPENADLANPAAAGQATFGFVSKYLPGTTTPSGNLEFQFKEGNLNFKSTSMELLVVTAQPRAQFTGTGTINGATVCKFDVDAYDGSFGNPGVDAFALKIHSCDPGGGNPVFTRYNLPPTPLTKGNIVIHQ